jgi:hypothetical protein
VHWEAPGFPHFWVGCVAVHPFADIHRRVHPTRRRTDGADAFDQFIGFGSQLICHYSAPFSRRFLPAHFFNRQAGFDHLFSEIVFILIVGVNLDRIVPGVDVPFLRVLPVMLRVGLRKTPPRCISLLNGKYQQDADEKHVDEEQRLMPSGMVQ